VSVAVADRAHTRVFELPLMYERNWCMGEIASPTVAYGMAFERR
jgi:hypothetical protein